MTFIPNKKDYDKYRDYYQTQKLYNELLIKSGQLVLRNDELHKVNETLSATLAAKERELQEAREQLKEWNQSFELYHKASKEAMQLVKGVNGLPSNLYPDMSRSIEWITDNLEKAIAEGYVCTEFSRTAPKQEGGKP